MKPTKAQAPGHPGYPQRPSIAERLVHEEPLAIAAALHRGHGRARELENTLELEAADPRVEPLYRQAKALRKAIAAVVADVRAEPSRDRDCPACLAGVESCEVLASAGGGRCCSGCVHV